MYERASIPLQVGVSLSDRHNSITINYDYINTKRFMFQAVRNERDLCGVAFLLFSVSVLLSFALFPALVETKLKSNPN